MSEQTPNPPQQPQQPRQPQQPNQPNQPPAEVITQPVPYSPVSARVPENRNRGTFATHALVLTGNQEFVCDFLLRMSPPFLLAARVVLPYSALPSVVQAIGQNVENFRARFGAPAPPPPPPPNVQPLNMVELYEQLKITDEVAVGCYANTLMISHSNAEFCMDFILDVFPRPVVTQRVYMSAPHVPVFLNTLKRTLEQLQQRAAQQQQHPPAAQQPSPPPPTDTPPPT